jgi:alpha-mannosidase
MWVEPDLNMPDGESLVRQLLVGKRWYKQHYGVDVRIGWNPDSFGYNWQLPQIYKKLRRRLLRHPEDDLERHQPAPLQALLVGVARRQQSPRLLPARLRQRQPEPRPPLADLATARQRAPGMTEMMDLYGIGDHGGGPTRAILDEGEALDPEPRTTVVAAEFGIAQSFFSSRRKADRPDSPPGTTHRSPRATPHPRPKANRHPHLERRAVLRIPPRRHDHPGQPQAQHARSEEWPQRRKIWSSLAWLDGKPYPGAELTEAWKQVLFNQFHDLAAGSGIGVIYKDAQKDYDGPLDQRNEASTNSLQDHRRQHRHALKDGVPVLVFNPLAWRQKSRIQMSLSRRPRA